MNAALRAWALVAPDAPFVALVSTLQVAGAAGLYPEITAPLVLLSLPVTIVLYGRVLARLVPSEPKGAGAILGLHAFDWLVVTVLVAVPLVGVGFLLGTLRVPVEVRFGAGIVAKAAVWTATMYALPLAFLVRRSLAALVGGFAFLRGHRAESRWIAGTILVVAATATTGSWLYRLDTAPWSFTLAVAGGVVTGLLNFIVFAGALRNLVEAGVDRRTIARDGVQ